MDTRWDPRLVPVVPSTLRRLPLADSRAPHDALCPRAVAFTPSDTRSDPKVVARAQGLIDQYSAFEVLRRHRRLRLRWMRAPPDGAPAAAGRLMTAHATDTLRVRSAFAASCDRHRCSGDG